MCKNYIVIGQLSHAYKVFTQMIENRTELRKRNYQNYEEHFLGNINDSKIRLLLLLRVFSSFLAGNEELLPFSFAFLQSPV